MHRAMPNGSGQVFLNEPEASMSVQSVLQSLVASCPSSFSSFHTSPLVNVFGGAAAPSWTDDAAAFIASFEQEVATACGKERALFFTSAMAANITALTVNARDRFKVVALHKQSLMEAGYGDALSTTLGFSKVFTGARLDAPPSYKDVVGAAKSNWKLPGVVSLEIPLQGAGGQCVPWEDVEDIRGFCSDSGIRLHLDTTGPHEALGRYGFAGPAQLLAPFDSAVVDFAHGLGCPLGGALLLGDADFIATARAIAAATATSPAPAQALPPALAAAAAWRARGDSGALAGRAASLRALLSETAVALGSAGVPARAVRFHPALPQSNKVLVVLRGSAQQCLAAAASAAASAGTPQLFGAIAGVSRAGDYSAEALATLQRRARYPLAVLSSPAAAAAKTGASAGASASASAGASEEPESAFLLELGPANGALTAATLSAALRAVLDQLPAARQAHPFPAEPATSAASAGASGAASVAGGRPGTAKGARRPESAARGREAAGAEAATAAAARNVTLSRLTTTRSSATLLSSGGGGAGGVGGSGMRSAASAAEREALEASRERARGDAGADRALGGFTGYSGSGGYGDEWPQSDDVEADVGADGVELGTEVVPVTLAPLSDSDNDDDGDAGDSDKPAAAATPVKPAAASAGSASSVRITGLGSPLPSSSSGGGGKPLVTGVKPAPPVEGSGAKPGARTFKFGLGAGSAGGAGASAGAAK